MSQNAKKQKPQKRLKPKSVPSKKKSHQITGLMTGQMMRLMNACAGLSPVMRS